MDGTDSVTTLREAVEMANNAPGAHTIVFDRRLNPSDELVREQHTRVQTGSSTRPFLAPAGPSYFAKVGYMAVRSHDLVTVPDEPLRIIEMPEHRRGVATAYCDSSGPLEPKPETFYAIAPGLVDTDLARAFFGSSPEVAEAYLRNTPLGRLGSTSDQAQVVVFLASSASDYVHGTVLAVDGGWLGR